MCNFLSPTETYRTAADIGIGKTEVKYVEYQWRSPTDFKIYPIVSSKQSTGNVATTSTGEPSGSYRGRHFRNSWRRPRPQIRRPTPSSDAALLNRRQVYSTQSYCLHVGSNRISRFQDLTPQIFSRDPELISRARKWIRRELQVFEFLSLDGNREEGISRRANNAEFLLEYIIAILKTVDIKGSGGQAEDMLQEFLGRDNTRLFLHELRAWLRSPYVSLEDWDRHVQYAEHVGRTPNGGKYRSSSGASHTCRDNSGPEYQSTGAMKRKASPSRVECYRSPTFHGDLSSKRRTLRRDVPD